VKEVIGSCVSNGVKVEGKPAKELYADISAGKYDELFK
jgi:large subunit ribosomal protein L11